MKYDRLGWFRFSLLVCGCISFISLYCCLDACRAASLLGDVTAPTTTTTTTTGTVSPTTPAVNNAIVAFGDSVTEGRGGFAPYSAHLQNLIGSCANVVNSGLGGERTSGGVSRIEKVLNNTQPREIIIMEGANDAFWGVSPSSVKFNLGVMIDKARAKGATPILSTITPNQRNSGLGNAIPLSYNPPIRSLAGEKGVVLVDSYQNVASEWSALSFDGVHPNDAGAIRLAEGFSAAVSCKGGGSGSGSGGGGGGCFIATAAFGSAIEPQVALLKTFRDRYLLTNTPGRWFVEFYYRSSPPLASFISQHPVLRAMVRTMLYPLIGFAYLMIEIEFSSLFLALVLMASASLALLAVVRKRAS